ncbi:short coiled-coil protein isoform X2 [Parus major]|uniref:short coiled-coil protein isoform X2 n=1 Tax=Parus major TaxID=9157 RepID=UPI0014446623|nr:short coiled-coil protein isoform X2 [Parus major]
MTRSQPLPQSPLVAVKKGWRSRPAPRAAQAHWQRRAGRAGPGQSPREAVAAGQVRGRCRGVDPEYRSRKLSAKVEGAPTTMMNADMDAVENQVELEEKTRLINQVLELQHTLEDTIGRNLRGNLHVHLMETGINQPEVLPSTRMKREENRKERPTCKPWPKLLPLPTT